METLLRSDGLQEAEAARIGNWINSRTWGRVQNLRVEMAHGKLVISGVRVRITPVNSRWRRHPKRSARTKNRFRSRFASKCVAGESER